MRPPGMRRRSLPPFPLPLPFSLSLPLPVPAAEPEARPARRGLWLLPVEGCCELGEIALPVKDRIGFLVGKGCCLTGKSLFPTAAGPFQFQHRHGTAAGLSVVSQEWSLGWQSPQGSDHSLFWVCSQSFVLFGAHTVMPWTWHSSEPPKAWTGGVLPAFPLSGLFLTCCLPCSRPAGLKGIAGRAGLDLTPIEWGKFGVGLCLFTTRKGGRLCQALGAQQPLEPCSVSFAHHKAGLGAAKPWNLLIQGRWGVFDQCWELLGGERRLWCRP